MRYLLLSIPVFLLAASAKAEEPLKFSLPLDCPISAESNTGGCIVQTVMDHNTGDGVDDFQCGARSNNSPSKFGAAHQGTDIGPIDWMGDTGDIRVLAAAPGRVAALRDSVSDNTYPGQLSELQKAGKAPPACGNGIVIDHGGGLMSQYCHLRRGSLRVKEGEHVARGQPIGLMGISGQTTHPHLHFQVLKQIAAKFTPLDPFDGTLITQSCVASAASLWDAPTAKMLQVYPMRLIKHGFTDRHVDGASLIKDVRAVAELPLDGERVVAFAAYAGGHPGARAAITVRDKNGEVVFSNSRPVDRYRTRQWVAADIKSARRFRGTKGRYSLTVKLYDRNNQLMDEASAITILR